MALTATVVQEYVRAIRVRTRDGGTTWYGTFAEDFS